MASFHIDHDVPASLARELIARGHSAYTARDLGLEAAGDPVHMRHAAQNGRILVTHNKHDFVLLHAAWLDWLGGSPHGGILIIKQQKLLVPDMADAIDDFFKGGRDMSNKAFEWMPNGTWVRR